MKKNKILEVLFVFSMLVVLFALLFNSVVRESRAYDEVTYVNAGYGFLTRHDFRLDPFNPPLARELVALPMLFDKNIVNDPTLFWPRIVVVIVTLLFGLLIYFFGKKLFGTKAGMLALILFVFEPNILTNGHYATMDLIFSFFFILVLYLFWIWRNNFTFFKIILFSVVLGLTLSTKISALPFLLPSLFLIYIIQRKKRKELLKAFYWKKRKKLVLLLLITTLLSLWSTYFFTLEPPLGYRFDPNRPAIKLAKSNKIVELALTQPVPLGSYISTIKQQFVYNYSGWYRKDSFVFGNLSRTGHPGYYFPLIILFKTPIPLLMLFLISLFLSIRNLKGSVILLIPIIVILSQILLTNVTLVLRYILPIYPLIILFSSQAVNIKTKKPLFKFIFLIVLLAWFVFGTLRSYPYYISFVNELGGGSTNGYKYVFDSNLDWGQGLLDLKEYQKKNKIYNLQLAYFGDLDPKSLGIKYERIEDASLNDNQKIKNLKLDNNHVIAISATCWYLCGYYKNSNINYKKPGEIVGGSILIFNNK
ncbi:MAG: glycosyltransferase family 39 protein [Candidatus Levybacteria bacterium]|nr:glycosyltransferase family 39 protein [Candidatus Levybacteria bacterium]